MSDHYLVTSTTFFNYKPPPKTVITGRSYKDYSAELAREFYNTQRLDLIYQYTDVDLIWSILRKYIENCANNLCPVKQIKINTDKPPWFATELVEMVKDKDRAFEKAYASKDDNDLLYAKRLRTSTKRAIRNARAEFIKGKLAEVADNPGKILVGN